MVRAAGSNGSGWSAMETRPRCRCLLYASAMARRPLHRRELPPGRRPAAGRGERLAPALVVADDAEAAGHGIDGVTVVSHTAFEAELAAATADRRCRRPHRPRRGGDLAVHQRHDRRAEGGRAAPPPPHVLRAVDRRVHGRGRGRGRARQRAAVPHRRRWRRSCRRLFAGRRIVYLPQFDADAWVRLGRRRGASPTPWWCPRCSAASSTPSKQQRRRRCPRSRTSPTAAAACRSPVIERAMTLLPDVNFVNAYGLTETSSTVAVLGPDDHRDAFGSDDPAVRARLGSVGRPLPTLELEIRDADGRRGARRASRARSTCGASRSPASTSVGSVLTDDGWFPTNDGGHLDEGGFLFVEGRHRRRHRPRRREHVARRDRGRAARPPGGGRGRRHRRARRRVGRGRSPPPSCSTPGPSADARPSCRTGCASGCARRGRPVVVEIRAELPYNETGKLLRRTLKEELGRLATSKSTPPNRHGSGCGHPEHGRRATTQTAGAGRRAQAMVRMPVSQVSKSPRSGAAMMCWTPGRLIGLALGADLVGFGGLGVPGHTRVRS